jgi:hypothetical protein
MACNTLGRLSEVPTFGKHALEPHGTDPLAAQPTASQFPHFQRFFLARPATSVYPALGRLQSALAGYFHLQVVAAFAVLKPLEPPYFFFQLQKVTSEMPIFPQTSSTRVPVSACLSAKATCCSVNLVVFLAMILPFKL